MLNQRPRYRTRLIISCSALNLALTHVFICITILCILKRRTLLRHRHPLERPSASGSALYHRPTPTDGPWMFIRRAATVHAAGPYRTQTSSMDPTARTERSRIGAGRGCRYIISSIVDQGQASSTCRCASYNIGRVCRRRQGRVSKVLSKIVIRR